MSSDSVEVRLTAEQYDGDAARVLRWLHRVGDEVTQDQPLVEVETDKVTVEVPSPATGRLAEIRRQENEATRTGDVLARIELGAATSAVSDVARAADRAVGAGAERATGTDPASATVTASAVGSASPDSLAVESSDASRARFSATSGAAGAAAAENRLSPAVRQLLAQRDVDASQIVGTGQGGRITADDVLDHSIDGLRGRKVLHSPMRRRIAEHMAHSVAVAPHVTAVFEADLSAVIAHREANHASFAARGAKLTFTAYFVAACVPALRAVPSINSRFHADALEVFDQMHIGVGTALGDQGLVVPVLRDVQTLDLFAIALGLTILIDEARSGKIPSKALRGGTFTISNHGVSGSLVAAPIIINQPQCAILGVGKLERRPSVVTQDGVETVAIRPKCFVSLTIDHRAIDGFQANQFLTALVGSLESFGA